MTVPTDNTGAVLDGGPCAACEREGGCAECFPERDDAVSLFAPVAPAHGVNQGVVDAYQAMHTWPFGDRFRVLSRERDLMLRDLSRTLNASPARVSDWMRGRKRPTPSEVHAIVVALAATKTEQLELEHLVQLPLPDWEAIREFAGMNGIDCLTFIETDETIADPPVPRRSW